MFKKLILTLWLVILTPTLCFASGRMIVSIDENVILTGQSDFKNPHFEWVLKRGDEIVNKKTGKQYSHVFKLPGSYLLSMLVSERNTNETESTNIDILVGRSNSFKDSLFLNLDTFPALRENIVSLNENSAQLNFILSSSKGEINEYRIDADLNIDSDLDGDSTNDIDNIDTDSYVSGELWSYEYDLSSLPTEAKITIIDADSQIEERTIKIQKSSENIRTLPVKAVLDTYPHTQSDKRIHLNGDMQEVAIYAANSQGDIIEYRIDSNLMDDSDGDGNTMNDIDNLKDPSFYSGSIFPLKLERAHGDRVVQLTVVTAERKGSRIQRKFVWDTDSDLIAKNEFRLYSDKTEGFVGETFYFGIEGINSSDYEIKWDFDGDKNADYTSSDTLATYVYENSGDFEVLAQIRNDKLKILKYATINVKAEERRSGLYKTKAPISNFEVDTEENKISFINNSIIDEELSDKQVSYFWKFGDGIGSTEEEPTHVYKKTGQYLVRLTVKDSSKQEHTKQQLIEVISINPKHFEENEEESPSEDIDLEIVESSQSNVEDDVIAEEEKNPPQNDSDSKATKSILYSLYIFTALIFIILAGIIVYLMILKIKHPDYTFAEIMEEEKERILSLLEGRDYSPPHGEIIAAGKEIQEATKEVLTRNNNPFKKEEEKEKKADKKDDAPIAPLGKSDGDIPDWLQNSEESNNSTKVKKEVTENKDQPAESKKNTTTQSNQEEEEEDDIPDWLKP